MFYLSQEWETHSAFRVPFSYFILHSTTFYYPADNCSTILILFQLLFDDKINLPLVWRKSIFTTDSSSIYDIIFFSLSLFREIISFHFLVDFYFMCFILSFIFQLSLHIFLPLPFTIKWEMQKNSFTLFLFFIFFIFSPIIIL